MRREPYSSGSVQSQGVDIWSDYRPHQQAKASQGTTRGKHLVVQCDCTPGKWAESRHLVWHNYKPKAAPDWPLNSVGTKPSPQQAMWTITADWTEGNMSQRNSSVNTTHIGDPLAHWSGEQRTLYCRALLGLFFIWLLLSFSFFPSNNIFFFFLFFFFFFFFYYYFFFFLFLFF